MSRPRLSVRDLRIAIRGPRGLVPVVEGVSFDIEAGEILGLAGESGCGKSLTALALMGLLPPSLALVRAERLRLGSRDLLGLSDKGWRAVRGAGVAMVFQDPSTALDPVFTVGWQIAKAVGRARRLSGKQARAVTLEALESVGFSNPDRIWAAYPHELSGGMRQLALLAMAVASRPAVLLADEPTTALDVTTQALVLQELARLRERAGTSVLLVSHDLSVIAQCADRAMIMYFGRLVERAACETLFTSPSHPYTAGLLGAVPRLDTPRNQVVRPIRGQVPPPGHAVAGCPFAPRCDQAEISCHQGAPALVEHGAGEVSCIHPLPGSAS